MDAQTEQKLQLEEAYTYIERSRRKFIHSSIPDEGVIAVKALFLSVSISQMQFKNEFYYRQNSGIFLKVALIILHL